MAKLQRLPPVLLSLSSIIAAPALFSGLDAQETPWEGAWEWLHDRSAGRLMILNGSFCAVFGAKAREAPQGSLSEADRASLFRTMAGPMCGAISVVKPSDGTIVLESTVEFAARPRNVGAVSRRPTRVEGNRMEGDLLRRDGSISATWHYRRLSPPGAGPMAGSWRLDSEDWAGLLVMTDSEYRFVIHLEDRSDQADGRLSDLSDAEAAALYDAYDAEGGSYVANGASLFRTPAVARDPRLQGVRLKTPFERDGDALTLRIGDGDLHWVRAR